MFLARVSSLDHAPRESSAKVTNFQRLALCLDRYSLFLYNCLDFIFGCCCLYFGIYMYTKLGPVTFTHAEIAWLGWLSLGSGALLIISSWTGLCGVSSKQYRWCIGPSANLALIIAVMSLITCTLIFALRGFIIRYVESESEDLELTEKNVETFETYFEVLGYVFIGFFVLSILRYRASAHFRRNIYRSDGEFEALLDEEDAVSDQRMDADEAARSEKYQNLREHYRNKYSNTRESASIGSGDAQF